MTRGYKGIALGEGEAVRILMIDALYIATVGDLDRLDLWVRAWGFHHNIHLAKFQERIKAMIHLTNLMVAISAQKEPRDANPELYRI